MDTERTLQEIENLLQDYVNTSNRMVLTKIRQLVTKIGRKNPLLKVNRIPEIFNRVGLSMDILGGRS